MSAITSIGIAKEVESPENPGSLEKRVAMIPVDVEAIAKAGIVVSVEHGAGEGVGFSDQDYVAAGAVMQVHDELYAGKDMVMKFKGPALADISRMDRGSILFCMAHFHSFPERAKLLEDSGINVIAMEEVLESPKQQSDVEVLGRKGMARALKPMLDGGTIDQTDVRVIGWGTELQYTLRRAGNRDPKSVKLLQPDVTIEDCDAVGPQAIYVYDGRSFTDEHGLLDALRSRDTSLFDLAEFIEREGTDAIAEYRRSHQPYEFGLRRIQCLHETGRAGARYGVKLLRDNKPGIDVRGAKAVVLGYGNVGRGAIHELHEQGIREVCILGRTHTKADAIIPWLQGVDVVVNGAEQPRELRGKNFLITNDQVRDIIPDGSVVIDLVGGSASNRSPVEPVIACTFLTDPHFEQDGVTISALWGWPMLGMMRESAIKYSGQIREILIGRERLADGLGSLAKGVARALVCGPHERVP